MNGVSAGGKQVNGKAIVVVESTGRVQTAGSGSRGRPGEKPKTASSTRPRSGTRSATRSGSGGSNARRKNNKLLAESN